MGRLQTFPITLVMVLIFIAVKSAGLISSTVAGSAASGYPVTPTPVPTPSLSPIPWTIEPESSAEAPVLRNFILARIEVPVPGAKWYKVERVTDAAGTAVVEDDPYYPHWFDQREHVFRFVSTYGRSSAQDGPLYLRVSAWSEKEDDGGARVSAYSDVLAVYYDHSFENLEFDIEVDVDEQRPGEALLRAVPRDAGLATQIELYAWVYYTPNPDGTFRPSGPVYQTAKPELRVSFSEPGIKYVGLYGAWNGRYGWSANPTTASGVKSRPAPYVGTAGSRHFSPVALIVDPESGPPLQVAPGFDGPQYQLPQIAGDLRFPLDKDEISLFSGGGLYVPLGGSQPQFVEVQLPAGVEIVDYQSALRSWYNYRVADVSGEVSDGSLPVGYRRYRLVKDDPDTEWSYRNRDLPLYFVFTSEAVIGQYDLYIYLRAYNQPEDVQRQDNWQAVRIHCEQIPDVPLPQRLRTGITWADADLFAHSDSDPDLSFLSLYRKLGFNVVPFATTHWFDPDTHADVYYSPAERTGPAWEGLLYGPEHSTFYTGFQGEGIFSLLKWRVEDMDQFDFSRFGLTPEQLAEEKRRWRNALEYYAEPGVTHIDLAYDGVFLQRDLAALAEVVEATQPDYIFVDAEDFPTYDEWVNNVSKSANAEARRRPGESDTELANRIAGEFLAALADAVHAASPHTKVAFYAATPLYNYGFKAFRWEHFQDLGIVAQPSVYGIEHVLGLYGEYLRLNRAALPKGYELIPWITTGTYGEIDPAYVFDLVTHTFLNGATGFSAYPYARFDDMADYLNMARAIAVIAPYEVIIMDGDLAFDDIGDVENAVVSAMQLNGEYLIAVTPQDTTKRVSFTVHTGQSSDRHILYDLRHGTQQSYPSGGTVRVTASPGEGTVYRLVPTPPASQCVGDANANGVGDVLDIMATAARPGCVQYLPIVVANWRRPWPDSQLDAGL